MNVFDIVGPVMIGPSSSHTAGAVRLGRVAGALLGEPAVRARILLHGSFAKTYKGHGTDRALVAGIMGMLPSDARIRSSLSLARQLGLEVEFQPGAIENAHPNTARITLWDAAGNSVEVQGASVGGGNILVDRFNGMDVSISGQYTTLIVLHWDRPGVIAEVASLIGENEVNIANFRLSREARGGRAVMSIETDGLVEKSLCEQIRALPGILSATLMLPN
ncbi:MAG: L-serine ammonia-lyase, iron-sulfur-dependent, subunit beta [Provencibacterium sp.]|jgi:L-serine dehydratase|nr:L-serine ammonia-lyase, iron-sulfur-dependent, subunit beta [Provencibacterium sp.]